MWSNLKTMSWYLAILIGAVLLSRVFTQPKVSENVASRIVENQEKRITSATAFSTPSRSFAAKKKIFDPGGRGYFLSVFESAEASPGLTLVPTSGTAEIALLNMRGTVVHKWDVDAARARLLPSGHVLVVHGSTWGESTKRWARFMSTIIEYDWNAKPVWKYEAGAKVHHDVRRLANGNTLFLREIELPEEIQAKIRDPRRRKLRTITDEIVEINKEGKEVWSWKFYEHFDINYCGLRPCADGEGKQLKPKTLKDWSHTNSLSQLGPNKWYDGGDERFHPENLLILPRRFWIPMIIERKSGKVVWTYEEQDYRGGLGAPHEVQMIEQGKPGEGNILILDNGPGTHSGESFVLEINPISKKIEWVYDVGEEFYNKTRGSVQRLPNGNTLISWDRDGRILEVNKAGEIVWEVRIPSELSRARRYPLNYCESCQLAMNKSNHHS